MPEVSLVAIFDADKEGFLRSDRSLIQTIGRAARNVNGMAILYADKVTGSMRRAIEETERRREKQKAYNEAHGITPLGIRKAVADILEARPDTRHRKGRRERRAAEPAAPVYIDSPEVAARQIERLEREMYAKARDLQFEEAAQLRDRIQELKDRAFRPEAVGSI